MPLGEIVGEIAGGILRAFAQILVEGVLEIAVKGPGYMICRSFKRTVNPDGVAVVFTGFAFWAVIGVAGYYIYKVFVTHG